MPPPPPHTHTHRAFLQEFDGEFVNTDVTPEQWASGEVQLAVDPATGEAQAPRPRGLLDESQVKGVYDPDNAAAVEEGE